jgi:hypothetical protein
MGTTQGKMTEVIEPAVDVKNEVTQLKPAIKKSDTAMLLVSDEYRQLKMAVKSKKTKFEGQQLSIQTSQIQTPQMSKNNGSTPDK